MSLRRWLLLLLLPLLGVAWFLFRWATTDDFLAGPPEPRDVAVEAPAPAPPAAPESPSPAPRVAPPPAPAALRPSPAMGPSGAVAAELPAPQQMPAPSRAADASAVEEIERFPLTADGIHSAFKKALPDVQYCYESWTMIDPTLEGTLRIAMHLSSDGGSVATVTQIRIKQDAGMGHIAFEGCVLSALSDLQFDSNGSDMDVTYPLSFATRPAPR